MIKITSEFVGLDEFVKYIDKQDRERMPAVLVKALNNIAWAARAAVIEEMKLVFDRPTPWTLRRVFVEQASRERLYARVYIAEDKTDDKSPRYLVGEVEGGPRGQKPWERLLAQKGIIRDNQVLLPRQGLKLNQYGNVSPGVIRQILSGLQAGSDATQDSPLEGQGYKGKRAGRKVVRRFSASHNREGVATIWQWDGIKGKPLFTTVNRTNYKRRLRVVEVVNNIAERIAWDEFIKAFAEVNN